jgi:hypothetical protein
MGTDYTGYRMDLQYPMVSRLYFLSIGTRRRYAWVVGEPSLFYQSCLIVNCGIFRYPVRANNSLSIECEPDADYEEKKHIGRHL